MKPAYITEDAVLKQRERYAALADYYAEIFQSDACLRFFSAPGRTEIGGNHTDHNHGKVLAGAVNLDTIAAACANGENIIRVKSVEYEKTDEVDIRILDPQDGEAEKSAALVRGVCAGLLNAGHKIGGFNAVTTTGVLKGSGLSSSAAFEVLLGTIMNHLFNNGKIEPPEIAKIAQYAENEFYKKPCGLMDQTASAVGSLVTIDFADTAKPDIQKIDFNFAATDHALCIVDTRADHADLTDEYAAIRSEMEAVAGYFGKSALRECSEAEVLANTAGIREKLGERPLLRAFHFFNENKRVDALANALKREDFGTFKSLITESGYSSYMYNQNVFSCKTPLSQPVSLALAVSDVLLKGRGAWRVHGGGFAGTIQAFVPNELLEVYQSTMEGIFGAGSCYVLSIRPAGGVEIAADSFC